MKYVASLSFGKDSMAMLIKILELGLPLDEIIYCDIRFDDEISGEMPLMAEFIPKAEKILEEKFGVKVKHLRGVTFKEQFYTVKKRGNRAGDIYGFPFAIGAWCNSRLKIYPIKEYLRDIDEPVIQYVGIAYDEPERYEKLNHETHRAPLYELKITEHEAKKICEEYGLLSPIYETSFRSGCWFCIKQRMKQVRYLYENYPNLWNILKEMEKDSYNTFIKYWGMEDLEKRFEEKKRKEMRRNGEKH